MVYCLLFFGRSVIEQGFLWCSASHFRDATFILEDGYSSPKLMRPDAMATRIDGVAVDLLSGAKEFAVCDSDIARSPVQPQRGNHRCHDLSSSNVPNAVDLWTLSMSAL